ncbi:MAG: TIGR04206 family protein [Halobacteriaceae archaeon]
MTRTRRRAGAVLAVLAVPLSVQVYPGQATALFAWGLATLDPPGVTTLPAYVRLAGGTPGYVAAWPLAAGLWALALASTLAGVRGREDARVTAGLLALAGVAALPLSLSFAVQPGRTAYPVGTAALWAVAAWSWWRA